MVNVKSKRCAHPDCNTIPTYNLPGEYLGRWCQQHASEKMINVVNKRCAHPDCVKHPSYNLCGEKAKWCQQHASADMVNVVSKRCAHPDCVKHPSYNLCGEKAKWCRQHASADMVNVKSKRCAHPDCNTIPSYNLPGEHAKWCQQHASADMVNVVNKRCAHPDCDTHPSYNLCGEKAKWCQQHASADMVNVYCNKRLREEDEEDDARLSLDQLHALKRSCRICELADTHYVCRECTQRSKGHPKEYTVVQYLRKHLRTPFVHDRVDAEGCDKLRPDLLFPLEGKTHCVIVEVDEFQHKHGNYLEECECARMNRIVSGIGGKSVIFVRYNPDGALHCGRRVNLPDRSTRLRVLAELVRSLVDETLSTFEVRLVQLYFDDCRDTPVYDPVQVEDLTHRLAV